VQTEREEEIDVGRLFATLWRGKVWVLLCGLVALAIGAWYAYGLATPVYTADATVALETRQEQVVDIESVMTGLSGDQASINTEVEVIRSRGLLGKLVERLDLDADPEFNPDLRPDAAISVGALIAWVRGFLPGSDEPRDLARPGSVRDRTIDAVLDRLSVSNVRQSYVFRITVTTEDPEKSALLANTLADLYILEQIEVKFDATAQATEWLTDRVGTLQVELERAEAALKDFTASSDIINADTLAALNRQIKDLRDRRSGVVATAEATAARLAALEGAIASGDIDRIAEAADDRTLTTLLPRVRSEAAGGRETFDARVDQIVARAQLEAARAASQVEAITGSIDEIENRIAGQSAELVELQQLQREAEASRLIYEYFLNRLKETSVQEGIQQADSRVLSRAVVPAAPSEPRKGMILALSLVLGLFAGSAAILGRELMQNTFRVADELESRTGYTVMGQIPLIPARRRKNVLKYLNDKPNSAAAEAVRNLRTSLLLSNIDRTPQVLMSTSSIPAEGKTTVSIALTQNLAGLDRRVLLIEGDLRRRVFAEYFDVKTNAGLLAVLSGEATFDEAVTHDPGLGADILVGDKSKANVGDIFSSDRFARFLEEMRARYDFVVIDTPPVLAVPDARVIAQSVDAVLYSVKWDSTSHRQVRDGLRLFESVNTPVAGLVMTQISPRGMKRYGYGDSYGAYNSYYSN
jgi:capsular exopolysaccharide synthesis family protein